MLRVCGRRILSGVIIEACWRAPRLRPPELVATAVLLLLEMDTE